MEVEQLRHIFPALAIARALKKHENVDFLFVRAKDRMEMQKIPAEGYKIIGLWISDLHKENLFYRNLLFPVSIV